MHVSSISGLFRTVVLDEPSLTSPSDRPKIAARWHRGQNFSLSKFMAGRATTHSDDVTNCRQLRGRTDRSGRQWQRRLMKALRYVAFSTEVN